MKKNKLATVALIALIFSIRGVLSGQVLLNVFECNNITASLPAGTYTEKGITAGVWSLEKQIAPEIWSEKDKVTFKGDTVAFRNLTPGVWRVILVESNLGNESAPVGSAARNSIGKSDAVEIVQCKNSLINASDYVMTYPNPAGNILYIKPLKASAKITGIKLISSTGELVKNVEGDSFNHELHTDGLPNGIYMLAIDLDHTHRLTKRVAIFK